MRLEQFNFLVSKYGPNLYKFAYRMTGDKQKAEDIVQETFISAWKSPNYEEKENDENWSLAWLIKILRRRYCDSIRNGVISKKLVFTDGELKVPVFDPEIQEFSDDLQKALNKLKPEFREALLLVVVGEMTHEEVSKILNVPMGTILSRISRARLYLRKELMEVNRTVRKPLGKRSPLRRVAGSNPVTSALR